MKSYIQMNITNSAIKLFNFSDIFFFMEIVIYCLPIVCIVGMVFFSKPLQKPMNFSQTCLDFLKILKESIQVLSKNGKLMGLVTIISLLLPSILFSLFRCLFQYIIDSIMGLDSSLFILPIIIFIPFINMMALLLSCSLAFQFSAIATILVSAASYTHDDGRLSLENLFSGMKGTWRRQLSNSFSNSRNPTRLQLAVGAVGDVAICLMNIVFSPSYSCMISMSSDWPLSSVVSVVEESSDGGEAAEKARRLVEDHGVHDLMHGLVYCVLQVCCVVLLVFDGAGGGPMVDVTRGLLLLNTVSLGRIFWCVLHTVLYFDITNPKAKRS